MSFAQRVEYFTSLKIHGGDLQERPLPHGDSSQVHGMFLMWIVVWFVGEAVHALQRSSVVSPTTASKSTGMWTRDVCFHDMSLHVSLILLAAADASIDTDEYIMILPYLSHCLVSIAPALLMT